MLPDPEAIIQEYSPAQVALAQAALDKMNAKVAQLLYPLEREILIGGWKPEYAEIIWETVAAEAQARARKAHDSR